MFAAGRSRHNREEGQAGSPVYRGTGQLPNMRSTGTTQCSMHAIASRLASSQVEPWETRPRSVMYIIINHKKVGYTVASRYGTMFPSQGPPAGGHPHHPTHTHSATPSWKPRHVTDEGPKHQTMSYPAGIAATTSFPASRICSCSRCYFQTARRGIIMTLPGHE